METEMPLADITVLDATQALSGPVCAMFLADLGADVIKVEPPTGEQARAGSHELDGEPISTGFELTNRNKRSLSIDLKTDDGQEIIHELAREADVFIQNWRPSVAERLSVDYDTLSRDNEGLIYVQISGYGETGPRALAPAMDPIIQHASGMTSIQGREEDPPTKMQGAPPDYLAGHNAAIGVLGALRHRDKGGGGQKVSISMLEAMMHYSNAAFEQYLNLGIEPQKAGRGNPTLPDLLYGAVEADDGWVAVALVLFSDRMWDAYCDIVDRDDLRDHPKYQTAEGRINDLAELNAEFENWLADQPAEEAIDVLNEKGIPAGPVNTIAEAAEMDQVEHRGSIVEVDHPRYGTLEFTNTPLSGLSETPGEIRHHAPRLGEHNREILTELGYSAEDIARFETDGVVRAPDDEPTTAETED